MAVEIYKADLETYSKFLKVFLDISGPFFKFFAKIDKKLTLYEFDKSPLFPIIKIQHDLNDSKEHVESLRLKYLVQMDNVKDTVSSKTAVPTAQVYPQFISLAHLWSAFQDEMVLVSVLSNLISSLDQFAQVYLIHNLVLLFSFIFKNFL